MKTLENLLLRAPSHYRCCTFRHQRNSSEFSFPKHPLLSGPYTLDLSGLGDSTGSSATAGLAFRNTRNHKLFHNLTFMNPCIVI
jgi:hypothetical protein